VFYIFIISSPPQELDSVNKIAGKIVAARAVMRKSIAEKFQNSIDSIGKNRDSDHIIKLDNDQHNCGRRAASKGNGKSANGIRRPHIVRGR